MERVMEVSTAIIVLSTTTGVIGAVGTFLGDRGLSNFWILFIIIIYILIVMIFMMWLWRKTR